MAYDCYCAICGVGFCGMHIETPSQTSLERRRRWIEKRYRAMEASRNNCQVPHDPSEDHTDPVRSYDPRIVGWDNVSWLYQAYCLGSNQQASGKNKAFISGPGYYADIGEVAVKAESASNNTQKRSVFACYGSGTGDSPGPVIPFHWCCFEILTRALTGSTNPDHVDMEVLYAVMMDLCNMSGSALHLSYGDEVQESQGRYWECIPGAEYCATHPTETPALNDFIRNDVIMNKELRVPPAKLHLHGRQPASPFGRLPLEMVYHICSFLPGESLKALTQASLNVQIVTQHNYFWEKAVQWDMPWFWEFHALKSESPLPDDINYKRLYLWLDKMTTPRYGMDDQALTGVANRRRIWGVCQQLAPRYFQGLKQQK
ncbi:F-box domain protein [Aspergillus ambiguus]|uniref:F-box domain protein n=1 Tax=Aspergillus ambiguus TaxID=176160 RepID=UPI003CCD4CB5